MLLLLRCIIGTEEWRFSLREKVVRDSSTEWIPARNQIATREKKRGNWTIRLFSSLHEECEWEEGRGRSEGGRDRQTKVMGEGWRGEGGGQMLGGG